MEEFIRISAVYNGGCVAAEGDAVLDLRPVYEQKTADALEYHAEVTNRSSETVVLETVHDVYFRDCEFGSQDFNNKMV